MRETFEEAVRGVTTTFESVSLEPIQLAVVLVLFAVAILTLARFVRRRRRSADVRTSRRRHREATERPPPVDVGDVVTLGVREFSRHHSGERHAVGKVEGFVVFVENVPTDVDVADVIRAKVLSYNRGATSATATYLGRG